MTVPAKVRDAGRRAEIEEALTDRFHVIWSYIHGVSTTQFDIPESLDNQARITNVINPDWVMSYRRRNERGDRAPAVIAFTPGRSKNALRISEDGNHRLLAALSLADLTALASNDTLPDDTIKALRKIRFDTEDAFPLDVYELDRATKAPMLTKIRYYFNSLHGLATTPEERVEQALELYQNGARSVQAAADEVQADVRKLQSRINKINFDARANETGVDPREWAALPPSTKSALKRIKTDEGFRAASHLAYIAALSQPETAALVSDLGTSASAKKHGELLRAKTEEYRDRIQQTGGGLNREGVDKKGMSVRSRVGIAMAGLAKIPDDFESVARLYSVHDDREQIATDMDYQAERLHKLAAAIRP